MNLKERKMVHRVYAALHDVPGAYIGGGMKTTTVKGVVSFGHDIEKVRDWCGNALMALFDGSLSTAERNEQFEAAMGSAEQYIAKRKAESWTASIG